MGESFSKKENRNKKMKVKENKAQKKEERKVNNSKGKSLEDMLAYVDEDGNLSSEPPRQTQRAEIDPKDIRIGATPRPPEDNTRTGIITFFNTLKGFGFITDDKSGESVFFHINQLSEPVKERDSVSFVREKSARGYNAIAVTKAGSRSGKS
ncbi:cold shock domain-containing protein [Chitinophaga polysaccharea]|uniref:cold shock domain-containing protein n=1 Tax=Chitinophaga TaxID=79328 RepID=UPI0014557993|nr:MULTISPECIES: cold shock domain-containing protein [Chitinophaga]NLR61033.1 cold shock domain-containing protein [Chitinophaga polysaccharea]NLU96242.1 cold shock domain-containing protein [Chitinophaga sp. Ak27]